MLQLRLRRRSAQPGPMGFEKPGLAPCPRGQIVKVNEGDMEKGMNEIVAVFVLEDLMEHRQQEIVADYEGVTSHRRDG